MKLGARVTDDHKCPKFSLGVRHLGGAIFPAAQLAVQAEGEQAARLADYAACFCATDVVFEGAATVLAGGLPFSRITDGTVHKGLVVTSASTVLVGGPTFSLPPNFEAKGSAAFQNALVRDLFYLSTLPSGRALIDRLARSGQPITFVPCDDPHNSFCGAKDWEKAKQFQPTGSTIGYNPDVAFHAYDKDGKEISEPPQAVLAHEMVHALDNAEGHHYQGIDPYAPASEPKIEEEESAAIGTGGHTHDYPTENSVRADMGLPRRDNHFGKNSDTPTGNARPGGY